MFGVLGEHRRERSRDKVSDFGVWALRNAAAEQGVEILTIVGELTNYFRIARDWGAVRKYSLQVSEFKWRVGVFPSRLEFFSNFCHVGFFLRFQTLQKAKKRAWISWVLLEIGTKDSLCAVRLAVQQQCGSQRLADWIKPFGWLAVIEAVLDFYRLLPILD